MLLPFRCAPQGNFNVAIGKLSDKPPELSNKTRLENVLCFAADLLCRLGKPYDGHEVLHLVKILSDKISLDCPAKCTAPQSKNHTCDIPKIYDYIRFDGDNYIWKDGNIALTPALNFELGCIFEIGRMMHESGICLRDLLDRGLAYSVQGFGSSERL